MNQKTFATVAADAVMNGHTVMNDAVVIYDPDTDTFDWQSSLIPLQDGQIIVLNVTQSGYDPADGDADDWETFFASPDYDWSELVWQIENRND